MIWPLLITMSLALSWMLSPDALVLLGNSTGQGGVNILAGLIVGALLSIWCISFIHHPSLRKSGTTPTEQLIETLGTRLAGTLIAASRVALVIFLPTGMLVTAGFTFNETFLHWFPNFGFSFLLLGILLTLHLLGEKFVQSAQLIFTGTAAISLLALSLVGITSQTDQAFTSFSLDFSSTARIVLIAPLLFLGYDHILQDTVHSKKLYWCAITAGFALLSLWALASLLHVAPIKLSSSTVPYILSAREIMGQPGRILIGIAIIAGACGSVNWFFLLASSSLIQLTEAVSLQHLKINGWKKRIFPAIFTVTISVCMATGLAGDDNLEVYIYGALLLWLVSTGASCYAAARQLRMHITTSVRHGYLLSAIFPLCAISLAATHNQSGQVFTFCFFSLVISAIFFTLFLWLTRKIFASSPLDNKGDVS